MTTDHQVLCIEHIDDDGVATMTNHMGRFVHYSHTSVLVRKAVHTATLTGPDLAYWVARANLRGHAQESNVIRSHYGQADRNDPGSEDSMRAFVTLKIGPVLPDRSTWY